MDPRYNWPHQGPPNGPYAPPPNVNGYPTPPNGYPPQQYIPQQMPGMYQQQMQQMQPQTMHPRVVIPPRIQIPSPQQPVVQGQHRPAQPQVMAAPRNPAPFPQMGNPRIRQVQVPVHRTNGAHHSSHGNMQRPAVPPVAKPQQRAQSYQENLSAPQQRTPSNPMSGQNRAPLATHSTPQQRQQIPSQAPQVQHRTPVQSPSAQQERPQPQQQRSHPQVVIKRATSQTSTHPTKAQPVAPAEQSQLPVDMSVLLLSFADGFISKAHGMGPLAALAQRAGDLEQYYKLMVTALGCMETVLKNYNLAPRAEAELRLRYAGMLVEETDNNVVIEEVLMKGITLCQRARLPDLKYSMQHLQARYQFKSNRRAALKSLDQPISEAETFQHIAWVYAFRFLKVSLALQVPGKPESSSALQQLHAISNHARQRGDRAIFVTAAALEAAIHLRTPGPDHFEHAQRAIASARSLQLQFSAQQLGHIASLIDYVDVACNLQQSRFDPAKMEALQRKVDRDPAPDSGYFSVLIERSSGGKTTLSTGGIFQRVEDGQDRLSFAWLPKNDMYALAYYLSGLTYQTSSRGLSYLQEGVKINRNALHNCKSSARSIPASISQGNWRITLDWQSRFALGLLACNQNDWTSAQAALASLRAQVGKAPFTSETYKRLITYASAVFDQSSGNITSAMATYESPMFTLPELTSTSSDFNTDLIILATMNRILILHDPNHPEHFLSGILFSQIEPLCVGHPNLFIDSAFRILRALTTAENSINRQKTLIHNALSESQKAQNPHFVALCLTYMTARFFADTMHEQALKSVRTARGVAKKSGSPLWQAVASGLCIHTFQKNQLFDDAQKCQDEFVALRDRLPVAIGGTGRVEEDDEDLDAEGEMEVDE